MNKAQAQIFKTPNFFILLVLALWWVGGCDCGWSTSHIQKPVGVHQVWTEEWILECSSGEGICKV